MRLSVAAILLGAAAASASSLTVRQLQNFPACGQTCLATANLGGCSISDTSCLCNNQQFVTSTTQCIESSCSGSDLQNAEAAARALCAQVGVTLTSTPPPASSTGAAASGSSTGASASTTPTSPASSGSSASTSAPATSSSAASGALTHGVSAVAGLAAIAAAFAL